MSITVEFKDFNEMLAFSEQLLGRTDESLKPAAQPEKMEQPGATPVTSSLPASQPTAAPTVQSAVTSSVAPKAPVVPTTAKEYTVDDLAKAAIPLMDAGGQRVLVDLLSQFGVTTLPQLPKEQYGAFATALRGLGAKI